MQLDHNTVRSSGDPHPMVLTSCTATALEFALDMATTAHAPLNAFEAERFVQDIQKFKLADVGGIKWLDQHENIEQLNIQVPSDLITGPQELE
jgi:hypothetical protein